MNRKGTGLVHIYFGDGKGKTTTGMGLCVRAAGYGYRVLIYQFMKNNKTSERNILEKIENVAIVNGLDQEKFSFQMTEQEKKERLAFYNSQFEKVTKKAVEEDFDVLFLDETIYTISAGLLDEKLVLASAAKTGKVVTIEEHSVIGGLGSAVCDVLSEKQPTKVMKIGINDVFGESGPALELIQKYGLDAQSIYEKVKAFVKQN